MNRKKSRKVKPAEEQPNEDAPDTAKPSGRNLAKPSRRISPNSSQENPGKPSGRSLITPPTEKKSVKPPRKRRSAKVQPLTSDTALLPLCRGRIVSAILRIAMHNRATRSISDKIDFPLHVTVREVLIEVFGFTPTRDVKKARYSRHVFNRGAVGGERAYRKASIATHNAFLRLERRGIIRRCNGRGGACLIDPDRD